MSGFPFLRRKPEPKAEPTPPAGEAFVIDVGTLADAILDDEALVTLSPQEKGDLLARIEARLRAAGWWIIYMHPTPGHVRTREPFRQLAEVLNSGHVYGTDLKWRINAVTEWLALKDRVPCMADALRPYPLHPAAATTPHQKLLTAEEAPKAGALDILNMLEFLRTCGAPEVAEAERNIEELYRARLEHLGIVS